MSSNKTLYWKKTKIINDKNIIWSDDATIKKITFDDMNDINEEIVYRLYGTKDNKTLLKDIRNDVMYCISDTSNEKKAKGYTLAFKLNVLNI